MIQLFDSCITAPPVLHAPNVLDIEQLSISLFAMGFEQEFISACQYRYFWDFKVLFPALHDGSFYGRRADASTKRANGSLEDLPPYCAARSRAPRIAYFA